VFIDPADKKPYVILYENEFIEDRPLLHEPNPVTYLLKFAENPEKETWEEKKPTYPFIRKAKAQLQETPQLILPTKKNPRFVLQKHYRCAEERGKPATEAEWNKCSLHLDLRFEINDDFLTGFTIMGDKKKLEKFGQVHDIYQVDIKQKIPHEWLTADTIFKPGEVGASPRGWGKMEIFDKGTYKPGVHKAYFVENFAEGKRVKGRLLARKVIRNGKHYWISWKAKDERPYVETAKLDEIMKGDAQLPEWCKEIYERRKTEEAKLEEAITPGQAPTLPEVTDEGNEEGRFCLHRLWYKSVSAPVRSGPTFESFQLRFKNHLFIMEHNPISVRSVSAVHRPCRNFEKWYKTENTELPPGSEFNPNKRIPVSAELIDRGTLVIYEDSVMFKKVKFRGKLMKGFYVCEREKEKADMWTIETSEGAPGKKRNELERVKAKAPESEIQGNSKAPESKIQGNEKLEGNNAI
jgi:hypothetical protein